MQKTDMHAFLHALVGAYQRGDFGGTTHEVHPALAPGSRENFLYFTLAPAINFQRSSEALWRAANATYEDPSTRFVFFPEESGRPENEYLAALTKHSLASFREKHTNIWYRLSRTLAQDYKADPRELLRSCNYDVVAVREELLRKRKDFPYLSGPKLSNYWLYILCCFTDAPLINRQAITIIPDVHVIRASVRLGLIPAVTDDREGVAEAWAAALEGTGFAPIDLHGPLWRWSRLGFPSVRSSDQP